MKLEKLGRVLANVGGAMLGIVIGLALMVMCGCKDTGVRITAADDSRTNLLNLDWEDYKIPAFSIYVGPRTTVWVNKDYKDIKSVEVTGTVTNCTSALAVYDSTEQKQLSMKVVFGEDYPTE